MLKCQFRFGDQKGIGILASTAREQKSNRQWVDMHWEYEIK